VEAEAMPQYIVLIHKDADSCYGVSFPDWPGVVAAGDTIDDAMQQAVEVSLSSGKMLMVSGKFLNLGQLMNCEPTRNFVRMQPML
jgi:HicB_like antitoxin of bacterial toxin-antitoxin system